MRNLLVLLCLLITQSVFSQKKYGFIIAIGDYPESSGWEQLASNNDIILVKTAFEQLGVAPNNIVILTDSLATAKNIKTRLTAIRDSLNEGDFLLIHYSGHGVQLEDDNTEEPDGLDEALVAYGAKYSEESLLSEDYIRDDTWGRLLDDVRTKIGAYGHLVAFIDACHSGSLSRSTKLGKARGGRSPLVSRKFKIDSTALAAEFGGGLENIVNDKIGKLILFSAANAQQVDYETFDDKGNPCGPLSLALFKSTARIDSNTTYQHFFSWIESEMASRVPNQSPVLEGNGIKNIWFNGKAAYDKSGYFKMDISRDTVRVHAGILQGIDENDELEIEDIKTNKRLTSFRVIRANNTESMGLIDSTLKFSDIHDLRGHLLHKKYERKVGLSLNLTDTLLHKRLKDSLNQIQGLTFKEKNAELNIEQDSTGIYLGIGTEKIPYLSMKSLNRADSSLYPTLTKIIKTYLRTQFLRQIDVENQKIPISFRLVPVKAAIINEGSMNEKLSIQDTISLSYFARLGSYYFPEGTKVLLELSNDSNKEIFYNVLDLQPDGRINPIIPNALGDFSEYKIAPKSKKIIQNTVLYPPYGKEIFKVFVANQPLNLIYFTEMQESLNIKTRASATDLLALLGDYSQGRAVDNQQLNELAVSSFYFNITRQEDRRSLLLPPLKSKENAPLKTIFYKKAFDNLPTESADFRQMKLKELRKYFKTDTEE